MSKIKISIVSYLNSQPFIYGLEQSELIKDITLERDIPSVCAEKLLTNKTDIGLIPVVVLPLFKNYTILTDYCIGAEGPVRSVALFSNEPLQNIKKILLDYQSRTSIQLTQVLAKYFWKINVEWINAAENYETQIDGNTAGVIIGDRALQQENKFKYRYDLAEEWIKFTGLPFVFACWVTNKNLPDSFIEKFNAAIKHGVDNRKNSLASFNDSLINKQEALNYLTRNISYELNEQKKKGLKEFLNYCSKENNSYQN